MAPPDAGLPFRVRAGRSGAVALDLRPDALDLGLQEPPSLRDDPADAAEELASHTRLRLDGPASDVAAAGLLLDTVWHEPCLWREPFAPTTALMLSLPDDEMGEAAAFQEVEIADLPEAEQDALLRKPSAAPGSRDYVRGSMASQPFAPGGEALPAVSGPAAAAAAEAATGAWLREWEAGGECPPKALAPGMSRGAFGAWAAPEAEPEPAPAAAGEAAAAAAAAEGQPPAGAARPEPAAPVSAAELFAGVWLLPEESQSDSASGSEPEAAEGAQAGGAADAGLQLPDLADIPGAVEDPATDALLRLPLPQPGAPPARQPGVTHAPTVTPAPAVAPAKRSPREATEWAVRGSIPDVPGAFEALRPRLAMTHPFELDLFQKEAVLHLEQGHSVFVAAHTSAGKTVVAEYAFALARQHCTRAVYTSPIKTISNQKYRDFSRQFEVGLLTGDVSLRPEAPFLIMTTEILRSMLYKGADIIRDIEWVIFDEVHYVNDAERGVVWEEVIIMLPPHVSIVMLSATVPNVLEFADWVGRTRRCRVAVTGTLKRPVPLEHSLFFDGRMFPIARGEALLPEGVAAARRAWKAKTAPPPLTKADAKAARPTGRGDGGRGAGLGRGAQAGRGGPGRLARGGAGNAAHGRAIAAATGGGGKPGWQSDKAFWAGLIRTLEKQQLLPAVVFCFSKKRVDLLADCLGGMDLTTTTEKSKISVFFDRAVSRLREADRRLPQLLRLREMLRRGLGVHHAGLLPIMKEVVEMLFCQGLIKALFSTETFAMGVNAPARTVVFQGLRKHDGKQFRTLLSGEYTQMAGRAGRRGLDAVGTVLIACTQDVPEEGEIWGLLSGKAGRLESQFRLTYTMILNLLRVEDLKVEDMLKRSFAEFHAQRAQPGALLAQQQGAAALAALRARPFPPSVLGTTRGDVRRFAELTARIDSLSAEVQGKVMGSRAASQALTPGRLVRLTHAASRLPQLGVVCGPAPSKRRNPFLSGGGSSSSSAADFCVLLLHTPSPLDAAADSGSGAGEAQAGAGGTRQPLHAGKAGGLRLPQQGSVGGVAYVLQEAAAADIADICAAKISVDPGILTGDAGALALALRQLASAAEAEQPPALLHPEKDLKINQFELVQAIRERQRLTEERAAMACAREPAWPEMWALVRSEALLERRLVALAHSLSDASLQQMPEFHQRLAVLRALGYVADDDTVLMKGRVACELNAGDELVTTEVVFAGVLSELSPEEAAAALAALVFQEKSEMEGAPAPTPALEDARTHMQALAVAAGQAQREAGLDVIPEDFCRETLKFGLMEVIYHWASGTSFEEISGLTDVMEGSIVRCAVRLDELCRQLRDAARVMGNTQLFQQMEAASAAIKRDIVFAASLYTT